MATGQTPQDNQIQNKSDCPHLNQFVAVQAQIENPDDDTVTFTRLWFCLDCGKDYETSETFIMSEYFTP